MPEKLDLGAFEHGLSVSNTYLFNVSLPGLACVCDKSRTGRRQVVPGAFPFTQLDGGGRGTVFLTAALRVRGWTGREAAALALTSDHTAGGKRGPETPTGPPGRFILEIYKCSSDVFGMRLLDSQGNVVRK